MIRQSIHRGLCTALLLATGAAAQVADQQPSQVILIIGDGMDEQQITIARNYLKGAQGELLLDQMPLRGASQILTIENTVDGKPV
jgi:alkaline phosphatase